MESGAGWSRMGSLFLAALVGGGAAVAIGAALESEDDGGTTTVFSAVASAGRLLDPDPGGLG